MIEEKMFAFALMGSEWVLWILIALSAVCLTVAVERVLFFTKNSTPLPALQNTLTKLFQRSSDQPLDAIRQQLQQLQGVEARILASGIEAFLQGGHSAAENTISGHIIFEKSRFEKGLIIIGTTGSNAPFVGLFGTVLGIIKAFADLASKTDEAATSVMSGISEALVATAIGLLVAIPSVVLYNYLRQSNKTRFSRLESMSHLVLASVQARTTEKEVSHGS